MSSPGERGRGREGLARFAAAALAIGVLAAIGFGAYRLLPWARFRWQQAKLDRRPGGVIADRGAERLAALAYGEPEAAQSMAVTSALDVALTVESAQWLPPGMLVIAYRVTNRAERPLLLDTSRLSAYLEPSGERAALGTGPGYHHGLKPAPTYLKPGATYAQTATVQAPRSVRAVAIVLPIGPSEAPGEVAAPTRAVASLTTEVQFSD